MSTSASRTIAFDPQSIPRHVDFGLLAALAMCLFTIWPLTQQPGLPNGTDTLYHIYRVAEMNRAWAHGVLMPTWAETFYFGYGSPVFHYYASLTYYATSLLIRLFQLAAVDSLRLLTTLCMLLAGGDMYLFMRDSLGKLAGIIAALVYVYSPYLVFTEPYTRGAYPELLALALFPLVMWRYQRLIHTGGGRALALATLSSGALIITHNLMALVLTGLLAGWVLWQGMLSWVQGRGARQASPLRGTILGGAALMLGVGLAGYFWIPVILEQGAVQLDNLTAVAQLDYRHFFVPLSDLLAFSPRPDAGAINGLLHQLNLGVAQWTLALAGIAGSLIALRRSASLRRLLPAVFFALAAILLIFLMLPQAAFLWQATAPLAFLQFPWRFLGPVAFCLAALAGGNAVWIERLAGRIGRPVVVLVLALPVALALPTLYVTEWTHPSVDTSVAAYHAAELSGLQRATTFSDEYLPSTVRVQPGPNADLLADYTDGYPVDKANHAALPKGVHLTPVDHGPQHDSWQVSADQAFTMEVLTFDFPGWQAEVDGQAVAVRASDPHGLITFEVPAGPHTIHLFLGSTPARALGVGVTLAVLLTLVAACVYLRRRGEVYLAPTTGPTGRPRYRRAVITAGIVQLALVLIFMREGLAWVDSPSGTALVAQHAVDYHLGDAIRLIGYDLNSRTFRPGDRLALTVYWYTDAPVDHGYAVFVHVSTGGPPLAQADAQNPAGRPTLAWTAEGYIRDPYLIDLPETLPPGEYQLFVGMYTCDTRPAGECGNGDRLPVTDDSGALLGDAVPLTTLTVR